MHNAEQVPIHRADPVRRRQALWALMVMVLVGLLLLLLYQWALARMGAALAMRDVDAAVAWARGIGISVLLLLWSSAAALGWLGWRFAATALREERMPPAAARLIRDTPVLLGAAARSRARLLQGLVLLLPLLAVLAGALLALLLWKL